MIFPAFFDIYNFVTILFTKMEISHLTPENGAWFPPTPIFSPMVPTIRRRELR